ncbi:class IV lanthionine synthetase LanL [Nonomuraea monospora]|uniref:class IV lanthionine synthetase LanL n=1 Tax=Nonomuraea monospora TaxID=568818 RepID=UPI0031D98ABC
MSAVVNVPDVLAEFAAAHGRDVHQDETWISVHDPAGGTPAQGWKIHVSARPGTLAETLARALPVLLEHGCDFKVARSPETLRELNSGDLDAGAVGKAITAYPAQDRVVALGQALADALAGMAAPRIVSDRRVRSDAPVYYRYAPFAPQYRVDENGDFELVVVGPDGERLPGAAGPEFSCPPWATDPFRPPVEVLSGEVTGDRPARLIGNRYQVTSGVVRGPRGNVYRATAPDGRPVIVKEARAYVGENTEGWDLRMYLRNELRVLGALRGLAGVPAPLDHFRHGEDEFLVMTDAGSLDLNRYVGENGLFTDGGGARDLGALAARLLSVLDAVHERGVVVRDLSPKNVVLGDDGSCTLIDFGNSRYDGLQLPGWTRGYSVPDQHTGRDSEPADDYFSLGATLFFACAGMNPLMIDPDPAANAERTLLILDRLFPGVTTGVVGLVPRLMSLDPATRTTAAADLRAGHLTSHPATADLGAGRLASRPATAPDLRAGHLAGPNADRPTGRSRSSAVSVRYTGELLSRVMRHTVRECTRFAESLMQVPDDARRTGPPVTNVYAGSAGLGMELLHHPESRDVALDLARWTARVMPTAVLPPGLYFGRTGTDVFLATALSGLPEPAPFELSGDQRADQAHGVAGIGSGHLALAVLDQDPRHLAVAAECARRLIAGEVTTSEDAIAPAQPGTGVAVDAAYAHGAAGCADFLLSYHEATGDGPAREAAAREVAALAVTAESLLGELAGPDARPMGASWCQGMAGIVTTLAHAAQVFGEDRHLDLAERGARACLALAPGAWVVSQCCGLAGIGESLVDLALMTGDAAYWRGAEEIAELTLLRAGGAFESPVFPGNDLDKAGYTWGTGAAGVLSFLRRLDRRTGPRLWTATPLV